MSQTSSSISFEKEPLTTIFSAPAECSSAAFTYYTAPDGTSIFWRDLDGPGTGSRSSCYPPSYAYQHSSGVTAEYSPGVCPDGYQAAQIAQDNSAAPVTSWCCPTGMSYQADYGCLTTVTTPTLVALNPSTSITISTPFIAVDWYIRVAWASSDLNTFTPRSAPVLATASQTVTTALQETTGTATSTSPVPSSTTSAASQGSSGLSTGAQAGIGVGVSVIGLLVIAAIIILWRRRRPSRNASPAQEPYTHTQWGKTAQEEEQQLPTYGTGYQDVKEQRHEAPDTAVMPVEADSSASRVELDSGWRGTEIQLASPTYR